MPNLLYFFCIPFISLCIVASASFLSRCYLKVLALSLSLLPLLYLLIYMTQWIGAEVNYPWLPFLSVNFYLKMDSLSFLFVGLVAFVIPYSILAADSKTTDQPRLFYSLILLLQGLLIGFFTARDLAVFTFFWEAILVPLYFLMSLWGGERGQRAAIKFIIYMIAGAALLVAAVLALYLGSDTLSEGKTFDLDQLSRIAQTVPYVEGIFAIFILAFAVKTPLFPFHGWLPDAYTTSSTSATILLSALLSKAGIYGVLRIGIDLFPSLMQEWSPLLVSLAIAGVIYAGLAAWMQQDYKRLIAYSSLSHVNFILAGLFIWNQTAHTGAILQAINHGITITALFLMVEWLIQRIQTTSITAYSGLAKYLPRLAWTTLFFVVASVALPGTNNFIGELIVLVGVFQAKPYMAALLAITIILSAIYMLRWMQLVYFREASPFHMHWIDISAKDIFFVIPLIFIILWIGIYPSPLLKQINFITETRQHLQQIQE